MDRAKDGRVLENFLSKQKVGFLHALSLEDSTTAVDDWVVVVGNEAGDMDSIASSIELAYLLSESSKEIDGFQGKRYVPLIQLERDDVQLRFENVKVFIHCFQDDNSYSSLLFLDDVKSYLPLSESISWALVDHNKLSSTLSTRPNVLAIFDHHEDSQSHTSTCVIQSIYVPAGSCVSVVSTQPEFLPYLQFVPARLIDLVLSALLLDTRDLRSIDKGGKATDRDIEAFEKLLPFSTFAGLPRLQLSQHFQSLESAKSSIDHLTVDQMLRRDTKQYETGISNSARENKSLRWSLASSVAPLSVWLDKAHRELKSSDASNAKNILEYLKNVITKFSRDSSRQLDLFGIGTSFKDQKGKHKRELAVLVFSENLRYILDKLEKQDTLQLSNWPVDESPWNITPDSTIWRFWKQNNVKATRKIIAPCLEQIIAQGGPTSP